MEILHHFDIKEYKKGILKKNSLDEEFLNANRFIQVHTSKGLI